MVKIFFIKFHFIGQRYSSGSSVYIYDLIFLNPFIFRLHISIFCKLPALQPHYIWLLRTLGVNIDPQKLYFVGENFLTTLRMR